MGSLTKTLELQVQEQIFEFFKDVDDTMLKLVILNIVYGSETKIDSVKTLVNKFKSDNGLTKAYENHKYDQEHPESMWRKCHGSDLEMLDMIQHGLLNLAFNRFLQTNEPVVIKQKVVKDKGIKPNKIKLLCDNDDVAQIHVMSDLGQEMTICGVNTDSKWTGVIEDKPTGRIDCPHCLAIIKQCKKMKL